MILARGCPAAIKVLRERCGVFEGVEDGGGGFRESGGGLGEVELSKSGGGFRKSGG